MKVIKRNGKKEKLDVGKIKRTLDFAAQGIKDVEISLVLEEIKSQLFDGITTTQLQQLILLSVSQNIQNDPGYSQIGARLLTQQLYKDIIGKKVFKNHEEHKKHFINYIKEAAKQGLLKPDLTKKFDLKKLANEIVPERDDLFRYNGLLMLNDRYLLKDKNGKIIETPQEFWMRIAMSLSVKEKNATEYAISFYQKMSSLEYIPSTPTLFYAGTPYSQLSSCYLLDVQDNIEHISKSVSDVMKLLKYSGGIGASITKLRASGSAIGKIQGVSAGPVPFIKMFDSVVGGINIGGRRRGALAIFCEPWHHDIKKFLALKRSTGDITLRANFLNTSVFTNDEFMKRAEHNEPWFLFDPKETPDLADLYGKAFSNKYNEYIKKAKQGKIKLYKVVKAKDLFEEIISALIETSHPWITFKDSGNVRNMIKNLGVIHSSNLCTEVFLPTDEKQTAVCNLASINLAKHIKGKDLDWEKLKSSVELAIRQLDNVIDVTFYPVPEAGNANKLSRPIGLGVMGLSDFLEKIGLHYASQEGIDLFDKIMEFISYHAIETSASLALEKGSFPKFKGSEWSKGLVPLDTLKDLEEHRGKQIVIEKASRLDWEALRKKVKKGMRNGTLLAIAPTATISILAETSQSIEPNFSNLYARKNIEGKFIEVNENLISELKKIGIWKKIREDLISHRGILSEINLIPSKLKIRFKTAFEIEPKFFIDYAARAQKWADMSISRNLYFNTKDISKILDSYLYAWKSGLKSTYYAFFKTSMSSQPVYLYKQPHKIITAPIPPPQVGICEVCQ